MTHAESIIHREFSADQRDFEVKSVTQSRYLDVFTADVMTKTKNIVTENTDNELWPE